MAQSQLSAPWPGEVGGSAAWEPAGAISDQPLDIWSQLPQAPITHLAISVTDQPDRTDISLVLSAWRAAERRLADHIEASPIRFAVLSEIAQLRAEYHRLFAQAMR